MSSIPPVQAVVLFGSRARGIAQTNSNWDLAVLAPHRMEKSVRKRLPLIANVNVFALDPDQLAQSVKFAGSLAFAIARDGMVLAGNWERPRRSDVRLDNKKFVRQMNWASAAVRDAIREAAFALLRGRESNYMAAVRSEKAAEFTAKCAFLIEGADPVGIHNLEELAQEFDTRFPDHEWVVRMQRLNGKTEVLRHAELGEGLPESLENSIQRASGAALLHLEALRTYARKHPESLDDILRVAEHANVSVKKIQERRYWDRLPAYARHELESWTVGAAQVEEHARSDKAEQELGRRKFGKKAVRP